uniref:Protein GrpE n=2 Tax=Rubinisphaera brasiliensis TaxID=119 RepID=F0SFU6_RUBBR|nr:Protein grpE [Rubinisphaera brasiliensis DSM 5305]
MAEEQERPVDETVAEQVEEQANAETDSAAEEAEPELSPLEQLQQQNSELEDRLVRTQAELVNYRRRTQNELDQFRKYEGLNLVRDLLPALDNLHRATDAAAKASDVENLKKGVEMVTQQIMETLRRYQVDAISAQGEEFDPNQHEAVVQQPSEDVPAMHVLAEVETGYKMQDRIVRPAKVVVSTGPAK